MTYKTIEPEFMKSGFRFHQLKRDGDTAIFHKVAIKGNVHPATYDAGFEVVKIGRHDGYELAGIAIEPAETFPGSEQWGISGWTYKNLFAAEQRYDSILGKISISLVDSEPDDPEINESTLPSIHRGRPRRNKITLVLPPGEFSTKDVAELNTVDYADAVFFLKDKIASGAVKSVREERRAPRGPMTKIFSVITS